MTRKIPLCPECNGMFQDGHFGGCNYQGPWPLEEPTMTDNHPNLALQLSLLAWRNMEQFIEGGYEPDTLLAICKNNIAVLKELKESK